MHELHKFLTVAESLGGSGVVVGGGAGGGGGVAGSDAVSAPKETSPSSCVMAPIRSASAPLCPLVGSTGCGRFRFRLAGGADGDGRRGRRGRAAGKAGTISGGEGTQR